jgi:hypothetical protein
MRLKLCVACGDTDPNHLDYHHLIPCSRGGTDDETNLITLCRVCHGKTHDANGGTWSNDIRKLISEGLARGRARAVNGKCGGRRSYAEAKPEVVALVKQMHAQHMSLRKISTALAAQGYMTAGGKPYAASAVQAMLKRRR